LIDGRDARLHGRVVIVRHAGPGTLVLRGEEPAAEARWRLTGSRTLAAGEAAVLVYDAAAARWQLSVERLVTLPVPQ
jgi:hypothetical protein